MRKHILWLIFGICILYWLWSWLYLWIPYGLFESPRLIEKPIQFKWDISDSWSTSTWVIVVWEELQNDIHIKAPKSVRSLYFTANAVNSDHRRENLSTLVKNTEINSVTIDIKTVSGYTSFAFDESKFGDIKPESNNIISDIKWEIEKLHEQWIYVIGRIVVFKDKYLAEKRPDLAIKWTNWVDVWTDYKGNKYVDPSATEVWDYIVEMSQAAYELGFDEINYDYIRFPTDGYISKTSYPFSDKLLLENPKWGKMMVIDSFSDYVTKKLRAKYQDIKISADIFGLVTNTDLFQIGQNLESFLLYYDFIWPMIYPSHYGVGYLWHQVPDNAPYEIFADALKNASKRIDSMNTQIMQATWSWTIYQIAEGFVPKYNFNNFQEISKTKIRPWLQWFTCSRCKWATPYTKTKFREQIRAIQDAGLDSWWVWSSGSNYYPEWYDSEE